VYTNRQAVYTEGIVCKSILKAHENYLSTFHFREIKSITFIKIKSNNNMEQNQDTSLFGLGIDPTSKTHLSEAARWAKFLAIVGMAMCVIMVIFGIIASTVVSNATKEMESSFGYQRSMDTGVLGMTMMVTYILIAILYFFPCLFTLRFANHMQNALNANDQDSLNESFKNLKVTFRYMGILTIIFLALFLLAFLVGGFGAMIGS